MFPCTEMTLLLRAALQTAAHCRVRVRPSVLSKAEGSPGSAVPRGERMWTFHCFAPRLHQPRLSRHDRAVHLPGVPGQPQRGGAQQHQHGLPAAARRRLPPKRGQSLVWQTHAGKNLAPLRHYLQWEPLRVRWEGEGKVVSAFACEGLVWARLWKQGRFHLFQSCPLLLR